MHDDIARIDQNPVALLQAIDRASAVTGFLQAPRQMFGGGGDMARRTAGGDDQRIGQRRAAFKIDRDDVFRLVVVQRFEDARDQRRIGGVCGNRFFGRFARCAFRGCLGGTGQRESRGLLTGQVASSIGRIERERGAREPSSEPLPEPLPDCMRTGRALH
ncbi:MAG: hypothetical protein BGO00_11360 [Alphaproteobacteria bacterium 62-8]|nr:MAG: hypothetical protein BGO00_11360 [Alphaproteobacteria bacterium 62-8]